MLNLQAFDALSFSKGCFIGQEVVARTHYLGRVKRRLFRFCANSPSTTLAPFDRLVTGDGEAVGSVVNAELGDNGCWEMLAVVATEAAHNKLRLEKDADAGFQVASLPYPLDELPTGEAKPTR